MDKNLNAETELTITDLFWENFLKLNDDAKQLDVPLATSVIANVSSVLTGCQWLAVTIMALDDGE